MAPPAEPGTPPTTTLAGAHRVFSGLSGNNLRKPAHILKWNFYLLCDSFVKQWVFEVGLLYLVARLSLRLPLEASRHAEGAVMGAQ